MSEQEYQVNAYGFAIHISPVEDEVESLHIEATSKSSHIIFESSKEGLLARRQKPLPSSSPSLPSSNKEVSEEETKAYQVKFNLGANPFAVTTTEGQMYIVIAYLREVNGKAIPHDKAKIAKIALTPSELDLIKDKTQAKDQSPNAFRLHKGDFVKASIKKRSFVQILGKPGHTREALIQGYEFTNQPTLLNPKQKPADRMNN